ncbi:hypothetical protein HDU98_011183 [Podochytrium sp. JEL0797]|nr:hypothetical protein HDU98_011183 [Podochytrium sp. JEL0797]
MAAAQKSLRKPVTYEPPQIHESTQPLQSPHDASAETSRLSSSRFRSMTDLGFAGSFSRTHLKPVAGSTEKPKTAQEQLERVRRLTVDDAEMVLHAKINSEKQPEDFQRKQKGSHRENRRFGSFSFKFKPTTTMTEKPLELIKSTASKIYNKLNFLKQKPFGTWNDIPAPTSQPLASAVTPTETHQRIPSVTHSFILQPSRGLSRQPSVSSFNSIATAPEYMFSSREVPRKPAPPRPVSLLAPAAEYGLYRDVLGPIPRSVKLVGGPRVSECQSLRVSGHVRQTYTRTLQQHGVPRARGAMPVKALPSIPLTETTDGIPTTQIFPSLVMTAEPESASANLSRANTMPLEIEQDVQLAETGPTGAEVELGEQVESAPPKETCEPPLEETNLPLQIEEKTDIVTNCNAMEEPTGLDEVSGADEFFDAPTETDHIKLEAPALASAENDIMKVLDTLADKLRAMGTGLGRKSLQPPLPFLNPISADNASIEKLNDAKSTVEAFLIQMQNTAEKNNHETDKAATPLLPTDPSNEEITRGLMKMNEFLTNSAGAEFKVVDLPDESEDENVDKDEIAKDSELLFQLLNRGDYVPEPDVGSSSDIPPQETTDQPAGSVATSTNPSSQTPSLSDAKMDLKKKFQEIRAKFNTQQNASFSSKSNRWFKKAPPPPPTNTCVLSEKLNSVGVDSGFVGLSENDAKENEV